MSRRAPPDYEDVGIIASTIVKRRPEEPHPRQRAAALRLLTVRRQLLA
jgi:hypothetical protein